MIQVDEEGYLVDPQAWTPQWAQTTAIALGLTLMEDHWRVIDFIRSDYQLRQVTPDARHAMRHLDPQDPQRGRRRMFELFPHGYAAQACRVAGMRRPRAWSTG